MFILYVLIVSGITQAKQSFMPKPNQTAAENCNKRHLKTRIKFQSKKNDLFNSLPFKCLLGFFTVILLFYFASTSNF